LPKRYLTGGGKRLKKSFKSICYLFNIFKKLKYFTKELAQFLKPRNEEELSRGAILIEFAVCMPVLIILLFYINDLVKLKRYYSQNEFMAQQMANIIQNISQKRGASDPTKLKITQIDLAYAFALSHQTMYPGTTMYYSGQGHGSFHLPLANIYYVKGTDDGKASCIWRAGVWTSSNSVISPKTLCHDATHAGVNNSIVKYKSNVSPEEIYPQLKTNSGDEKIIIELFSQWRASFKDNSGNKKNSLKEALGLYIATPKHIGTNPSSFFNTVVIFTPKPGLFDDEGPQ